MKSINTEPNKTEKKIFWKSEKPITFCNLKSHKANKGFSLREMKKKSFDRCWKEEAKGRLRKRGIPNDVRYQEWAEITLGCVVARRNQGLFLFVLEKQKGGKDLPSRPFFGFKRKAPLIYRIFCRKAELRSERQSMNPRYVRVRPSWDWVRRWPKA